MNRKTIIKLTFGGLILIFGFVGYVKLNSYINRLKEANDDIKKELINRDTLEKIGEDKYRRLVNTYNSEKNLSDSLKSRSNELYKLLKDKKEKPVIIGDVSIKFKDKTDTLRIAETVKDSIYTLNTQYPKEKPFIKYNAKVNIKNKQVEEDWKFNNIDLNLVVTEREDGLWDSYVIGNEHIEVTNLKVNTVKRITEKPKKNPLINLYGGAGVVKLSDKTEPTVNMGATVGRNNKAIVSGFVAPTTVFSNKPLFGASIMIKF